MNNKPQNSVTGRSLSSSSASSSNNVGRQTQTSTTSTLQNTGRQSDSMMSVSDMKRSRNTMKTSGVTAKKKNLLSEALAKGPSEMVLNSQKRFVNTNAMALKQAQSGPKMHAINTGMTTLKNQLPFTGRTDVDEANAIGREIKPQLQNFNKEVSAARKTESYAEKLETAADTAEAAGTALTIASVATGGTTGVAGVAIGAASAGLKGVAAGVRTKASLQYSDKADELERGGGGVNLLNSYAANNEAKRNGIKSDQNIKGAVLGGITTGLGAGAEAAEKVINNVGTTGEMIADKAISAINKRDTANKALAKGASVFEAEIMNPNQKTRQLNADTTLALRKQGQFVPKTTTTTTTTSPQNPRAESGGPGAFGDLGKMAKQPGRMGAMLNKLKPNLGRKK